MYYFYFEYPALGSSILGTEASLSKNIYKEILKQYYLQLKYWGKYVCPLMAYWLICRIFILWTDYTFIKKLIGYIYMYVYLKNIHDLLCLGKNF